MVRGTMRGLLRWGGHYRVGIGEMDRDHEALIELLNRLDEQFRNGENAEALQATLRRLVTEAQTHFRMEERLMKRLAYPRKDAHKAQHDFLIGHVAEFQREFEAGKAELTESVMTYLRDWLRDHLLVSDKQLGRFLEPLLRR
ncbi:MAG: hemerythrin family protein [Bryobacteraceae bacterium]|nr:hemerythrin family protein [Bryobacteraceae bacterium]